jgi:hypothetical protein
MGSIYSRAEQVIIWLGPSFEDSRLAIETLSNLAEGIIYHKEDSSVVNKPGSWAEYLRGSSEALTSNALSWFAIRDLLRRKWFSRLRFKLADKGKCVVKGLRMCFDSSSRHLVLHLLRSKLVDRIWAIELWNES